MVSHDLRAPIYSVENYLMVLKDLLNEKNLIEECQFFFERIRSNLASMETLIKDVTDFSRAGLSSGDERIIDLNTLVTDIINNIQWQAGKENFIVNIKDLPVVKMNYRKIHQVFENLLQNAYKFRKNENPACVDISFDVSLEKNLIFFSIKDEGIGIDKKFHNNLFDLFFRTREKNVEGTGAGLAITKNAIRSYGGDIWVDSETNKGSNFNFTLPYSVYVKSGEAI
jgi:signal transduction histidine kinase